MHIMVAASHNANNQKGVSLFIVISALLILAVLTISITAQLMAPTFAATSATQQTMRENNFRSALQILRPLIRMASLSSEQASGNLPKLDGSPYEIIIDGHPQAFHLQDVNGLIDINSASPNLLSAVLAGLGQDAHFEAVLQRRGVMPFKSVHAFSAFLNIEDQHNLEAVLTVNSGRRRINSQTAPLLLLQILAGQDGSRSHLVSQIDRRFFRVRPVTDVFVFQH